MKIYTSDDIETENAGRRLARQLQPGSFVALYGDLGVGKTAFVRGALSLLNPKAFVSSPTYTVMNDYSGGYGIYHFDLYRITDDDDLYSTGFYDIANGENTVFCEWCENCPEAIPEDAVTVRIERCDPDDQNKRMITVNIDDLC